MQRSICCGMACRSFNKWLYNVAFAGNIAENEDSNDQLINPFHCFVLILINLRQVLELFSLGILNNYLSKEIF